MVSTHTISEKPATDSVEYIETMGDDALKPSEAVADAVTKGQALSGYEALSPWKTVNTFRLCSFICFAAAFSAATDGYQIGSVKLDPCSTLMRRSTHDTNTCITVSTPASSPTKALSRVSRLKLARMVRNRSPHPFSALGALLCPSVKSLA
jgi:hypothetical protein